MAERVMATVTPAVLKWARESAGIPLDLAAQRIGVAPAKLSAAEDGSGLLTFPQLRKAASVYKRPLAVFFLNEPPAVELPVADFRRVPEALDAPISPELRLEVRRLNRKREVAAWLGDGAAIDWSYVGGITIDTAPTPEVVADGLRMHFGYSDDVRRQWRDEFQAFKWWRTAIESRGVLVFLSRRISVDEMRGFSIARKPFPVIALNRSDQPRPRIFTLLHEFTHLLLGESAMCDISEDLGMDARRRRIEIYCNAVAGETLVPRNELLAIDVVRHHRRNAVWSEVELQVIAAAFSVSLEVVLRRLLTLDLATLDEYRAYRARWARERQAERDTAEPQNWGEKQHEIAMRTQGLPFVRMVLEAMHRDEVTASDVSDFLDMKLDYLHDLELAVVAAGSSG
ncbi:MAG TPA: XRE family transcriptional regulator [Kofleriaceae bacterium]|jgi:Zn-dependent peptidase ImmA (M78 family)